LKKLLQLFTTPHFLGGTRECWAPSNAKLFHTYTSNWAKRLSKAERGNYELDDYLRQVLVGNILGDVYMRRFSENSNVRVIFRQGSTNASYLLHLYELFQRFVTSPPTVNTILDSKTGKTRHNISFSTLALPCFNDLYESFYDNKIKRIPDNIADLLTPVSLAYWIMDDGSFTGSGLKISTNAFSSRDLDLLINALEINFSIKASRNIQYKEKSQYTLYITKAQLPLVRSLVKDHMHPDMMYKLGPST
jgi:hypothetical protein